MRTIQKKIHDDSNIFLFSCTHWGSRFHHKSGWEELLEDINSKYDGVPASHNYGIHHGDAIEAIELTDPRFRIDTGAPDGVTGQIKYAIWELSKIRDKMIAYLEGNHEDKLHKLGNVAQYIATEVGIDGGTYSVVVEYQTLQGKLMFRQFAAHGVGTLRSSADDIIREKSNKALSLKKRLKKKMGNTILMSQGHTHQLHVVPPYEELLIQTKKKKGKMTLQQAYTMIDATADYIDPDLRWYANVGAFYKMYGDELEVYRPDDPLNSITSSYAERAGYDPIELGYLIVKVRDGEIVGIDRKAVD